MLKERVLKDLRSLANCWAVKVQQVVIRGTPDIIACINGKFIALELKRESAVKPEPLQIYELSKISKAGGLGYIVCPENWSEVFAEILLHDRY